MSDVAAASVAVDRGPCLVCQLSVWSNQPRSVSEGGYCHAECLKEVGPCYRCGTQIYNFHMHGFNDLGDYHVACIGKFHRACHVCKANVYDHEVCGYTPDKSKCYHKRCLSKVRATCFECNENISWRGKRIVLFSGEVVHKACFVKKPRIIKPQPNGQRELLGDCAICAQSVFKDELHEKNDQNHYMHAVCMVKQVPAVEQTVTKSFALPKIIVAAKNMVPLFAEPVVARVEEQVVEEQVVEKKVVKKKVQVKGICPFCEENIYATEERANDKEGRYFHIACHKKAHSRVEPGIAKKPLAFRKRKAILPKTINATKPLLSSTPLRAAAANVPAAAAKTSFVMSDTFYAQQDHHSRCESTGLDM